MGLFSRFSKKDSQASGQTDQDQFDTSAVKGQPKMSTKELETKLQKSQDELKAANQKVDDLQIQLNDKERKVSNSIIEERSKHVLSSMKFNPRLSE